MLYCVCAQEDMEVTAVSALADDTSLPGSVPRHTVGVQ